MSPDVVRSTATGFAAFVVTSLLLLATSWKDPADVSRAAAARQHDTVVASAVEASTQLRTMMLSHG